ncbi:MAG: NAD-dependent malic enzyme [Elusimicrobia bacterium]|nr:NAD-dependent malic enzyme [Elusimicrobiota bacterium]
MSIPHRRRSGTELLHTPLLNKGTAFTRDERLRHGLVGLLPPAVSTPDQQAARVLGNVRARATMLEKYVDMLSLLDRNETLFYKVVMENVTELMPVIYTPTVGQGCQLYAHLFRRARGLFISRHEKGMISDVLRNWPEPDVRVIVVTDGERILGLGDLGANGMGIPVGKLALYTACGGVPPSQTLPVTLDMGTNNAKLLDDPLYLGTRERRLEEPEFDALVAEFVAAVQKIHPKALIQFEDFANHNAFRMLQDYRGRACCFNDDIQGTAAVTLAGLYSAGRVTGRPLTEERILFHGAGEAAIGIADLVVDAMTSQGLGREEAKRRCWFVDSKGLVTAGRAGLQEHKRPYAHPHPPVTHLAEAVKTLRPTALIGVSGQARQFTREIVEEMARAHERPIVFALSNPTANSECTAEEAYGWSEGRALFASGSPFDPVTLGGRTFVSGQCNNAYIFPGVGMAVVATGARRVTDEMFSTAARALADLVSEADLAKGCLMPPLDSINDVSAHVAASVAALAHRRGLATEPEPADILADVRAKQYRPVYPDYR